MNQVTNSDWADLLGKTKGHHRVIQTNDRNHGISVNIDASFMAVWNCLFDWPSIDRTQEMQRIYGLWEQLTDHLTVDGQRSTTFAVPANPISQSAFPHTADLVPGMTPFQKVQVPWTCKPSNLKPILKE